MRDFAVILLAAGKGERMGGKVRKQYMEVSGRPLLYFPLLAFERSGAKEIILVVSAGDEAYVRSEIVEKYGISKAVAIVAGGAERYLSVYEGLKKVTRDYVLVHDGARCCITQQVIADAEEAAGRYDAAVAAVPSVDTVKLADEKGFVAATPPRETVWSVQTPQAFRTKLLRDAYATLFDRQAAGEDAFAGITDDAMLIERALPATPIRLVKGDVNNIKVTTPKDIAVAEEIIKKST